MSTDACAFCRPRPADAILFETASLIAMPDEFPLLPGHILIVPKAHLRCYGDGSPAIWQELEDAAGRVRAFLTDVYGGPINAVENGVTGQTVFHAHLHLVPGGLPSVPADVAAYDDVVSVDGWPDVGAHFGQYGEYYYVEIDRHRFVAASNGCPSARLLREHFARATGLGLDGQHLLHRAIPDDIVELRQRWRVWSETQH